MRHGIPVYHDMQQGYSTIAMVMLLMLFGMLMLKGLNHQLTTQIKMDADERRFLQAYFQADSALSWGIIQSWSALTADWQCRQPSRGGFSACIRKVNDSLALLRGEGQTGSSQSGFVLFQLAEIIEPPDDGQPVQLNALLQGRSDFCPLKTPTECAP